MVRRGVNNIVFMFCLVVTVTCRADPIPHIDRSRNDGGEDPAVVVHTHEEPVMSAQWSMLSSPGTNGSPLGQEQVTAALLDLGRNVDEANISESSDLLPPTERSSWRRYVTSPPHCPHCTFCPQVQLVSEFCNLKTTYYTLRLDAHFDSRGIVLIHTHYFDRHGHYY
eukprot:5622824-Pyramimonas_sp.AAC.2